MREKSHCGQSFLCAFTPERGDNFNKRRMERRMKRGRHERRILHGFMKGGRRRRLLLFFHLYYSLLFGPCKEFSLALFVVLFLHSCCSPSFFFISLLSSCSGCDQAEGCRDLSLMHTYTHTCTYSSKYIK